MGVAYLARGGTLDRFVRYQSASLPVSPKLRERRAQLIGDLRDAQQRAPQPLGTVVAAMENVRIGLLRRRGGVGTADSITTELDAAAEIGRRIEAEMEVQDLLKH